MENKVWDEVDRGGSAVVGRRGDDVGYGLSGWDKGKLGEWGRSV